MTIAELLAKLKIQPDQKSFDAADKLLGGIKSALIGLAAFASVKFFAGLVGDTVEAGGHIDDLAQSTGQTREELQELAFAGDQAGMTIDDTGAIVTKLSKNMYEAANGNKAMADTFRKAGISVKDAEGKLRPAADVLEDIGDKVASMPDGTEKTALAMELLGKSGTKAIPLLNAGGEGIRKYREEAHELGAVMSEETVKALDEFGDEQAKVKAALGGLRNTVVAELLPVMKEMVGNLLTWVKANRQIIAQKLKTVLEGIIFAVRIFASIIGKAVEVVGFLGNHLGILVAAIFAVVAALVIFKYESIAAALASAAAWALAALPIIIIAAGIFALILLLQDLYSWITGGDSVLKDFFNAFKEWIYDHTVGLIDDLRQKFIEFYEWVEKKVKGAFNAVFGSVNISSDFLARAQEAERRGLSGDAAQAFVNDPNALKTPATMPIPASATAAAAANNAVATNVGGVTIQVTPPAGANAKEVAEETKTAFDAFMQGYLRSAKAGTGVK